MILLGWEIGTGKRVEIPETGHLAWFGQTQLSGKTTALEAIAFRGELRAVAFITKQGEGGFLTGRMIPPYFSEPTNDEEQPLWRWVKSILEASQQRKLNFEEAWIIRCCEDPRSAKTLADVHANIKALLGGEGGYVEKGRGKKKKREWKYTRKPVTGINAGVYTSLKAYFDIVMPQLARLPYTKKLTLHPGLNVMDLREYAMETQALVIRSVMEWVYQHEKGVRVIVPEAQDFVPQGKNSPVKMACETLVRKAGANKNFMWLDSQDMAAVDKIMLRACSIVGIGVQTEMHEIDRSLAGLFTPQLRPVDIARLKIGEFFVRTPEARVTKCYVQPAWMESELHAQAIAKGEESVSSARQMLRAFKDSRKIDFNSYKTLGKDAVRLLAGAPHAGKEYPPHQLLQVQIQEPPADVEESESIPPVDAVPTAADQGADRTHRPGDSDGHVGAESDYSPLRGFGRSAVAPAERDSPQTSAEASHLGEGGNPNKQEPGKHENVFTKTPAESGDPGVRAADGISSDAGEVSPPPETVSGAFVRQRHCDDRGEIEDPMPAKTPPAERLKSFLDEGLIRISVVALEQALRDLLKDHAALIEAHDALTLRVQQLEKRPPDFQIPSDKGVDLQSNIRENGNGLRFTVPDLDYICTYVKAKFEKDPGVLELIARRPEFRVKIERPTVDMDDSTIIGRIARLIYEGYFKSSRNGPTVQKELKRRGCDQPTTNLYKPLNKLTEMGFLTLEPDGYQEVAEMKVFVEDEAEV
jgi:hypothetical protein